MPYRPKHPCNFPGCPCLTNERYCEEHKKKVNNDYNKYERDEFSKSFYNTPLWKATRKRQLETHPFCEECLKNGKRTKATMVDHINPIKQGGSLYDASNLQSLCWSCHSRKSVLEGSRFKRKG